MRDKHRGWVVSTPKAIIRSKRGNDKSKSQPQNPPNSHSCSVQPLGNQQREKIRANLLRKGLGTTKTQDSPTGLISLLTIPSPHTELPHYPNQEKRGRFCCQWNSRMKNFLLPQRSWSCDCKLSLCFPARMGRVSEVTLKLGWNPWGLSTGRLQSNLTCANHVLLKDSSALRVALS